MGEARCKHCGSKNVYGITRVVGFFSKIDDWNDSKRAEFKHRQKGDYSIKKKSFKEKDESNERVGVKC